MYSFFWEKFIFVTLTIQSFQNYFIFMKKLLFIAFLAPFFAFGQLFIDTTNYSIQNLVNNFFGSTATITNITGNTGPSSLAFFTATNTNLNINAGLFISTGSVFTAGGPNINSGTTTTNNLPGDADLDSLIPGYMTFDASVIEFDISTTDDSLKFVYSFASEEYEEFVGTNFNDVFGFFISGPGITGTQNISHVPLANIPVAINNVNCSTNSLYYVCNDAGNTVCTTGCPSSNTNTSIEFDGFTTPLCACVPVTPGQTYHIKIAVGDAGDQILDSGVFLSTESLSGSPTISCKVAFVPTTTGYDVAFNNKSLFAKSYLWDFGDGQTSMQRNPIHTYSNAGTYTVTLIGYNDWSSDTITQQVTILSTGVEAAQALNVAVFPNPTQGNLSIVNKENMPIHVTITDILGKNAYTTTIHDSETIDLNAFGKGLYFVNIQQGNKSQSMKIMNVK